MADGTIWFDTKIDTSSFNKGVDQMTETAKRGSKAQLDYALANVKKTKEAWLEAMLKDPSGQKAATIQAKAAFQSARESADALRWAMAETAPASKAVASVFSTVAAALAGVATAVTVTTIAVVALAAAIVVMIAAVGAMAVKAYQALKSLVNEMWSTMARSQALKIGIDHIKDSFDSVKMASYAAFLPLIEFAAPYIKMITDFLVNMFNLLGRIIAALLGQAKAWQYVAGSTRSATSAAQGALAAWDQINVLQRNQEPNAGAGRFVQVDVDKDLLQKTWESIKEWLRNNVIQPLTNWFLDMWAKIVEGANLAWEWLKGVWGLVTEWWNANVTTPIRDAFGGTWDYIVTWARDLWILVTLWFEYGVRGLGLIKDKLVQQWNTAWDTMERGAKRLVDKFMEYWTPIQTWFTDNVTAPVKKAWHSALNAVGKGFNSFSSGVAGVLTGMVNGVISIISTLVNSVISAINRLAEALNKVGKNLPGWQTIPSVASVSFSTVTIPPLVQFAPIPELAQGAVIPPNSRFAAILGDQTSGKNIEAPESLIRQIVSEEIGNIQARIQIDFAGTMGQFVRELKPYISREDVRIGKNLIEGSVT